MSGGGTPRPPKPTNYSKGGTTKKAEKAKPTAPKK
jgi:hypothetical protein